MGILKSKLQSFLRYNDLVVEISVFRRFLLRDTMHNAAYICRRAVSVRLSHSCIVSKLVNIFSNFRHRLV